MKLSEYNQKIRKEKYPETCHDYVKPKHPYVGVQCEQCGGELYDTHPGSTLMSYPAQKWVQCENCGERDLMIV